MVGTSRLLLVVLLSAALLAGCAGDDARKGNIVNLGDGSQVELKEDAPEEGRGSISGVVVDDRITPIEAANVTVSGLAQSALTDKDGLFLVTDLDPGLYTLSATAAGFLPVQTTAEVRVGETVKVRIVLATDTTPQPYRTTLQFEWYDEVGQGFADFAWDLFLAPLGAPQMCDQCYFPIVADGAVEEFTIEATWEDSIPDPIKETEYYWTLDDLDGGEYESDYFYNPGLASVGSNRFGNSTNFQLGLASEEEWVTYQQTAQVFVTLWYLEGAPEGWSFIAGDR